jgi:hypothetical protein
VSYNAIFSSSDGGELGRLAIVFQDEEHDAFGRIEGEAANILTQGVSPLASRNVCRDPRLHPPASKNEIAVERHSSPPVMAS